MKNQESVLFYKNIIKRRVINMIVKNYDINGALFDSKKVTLEMKSIYPLIKKYMNYSNKKQNYNKEREDIYY